MRWENMLLLELPFEGEHVGCILTILAKTNEWEWELVPPTVIDTYIYINIYIYMYRYKASDNSRPRT